MSIFPAFWGAEKVNNRKWDISVNIYPIEITKAFWDGDYHYQHDEKNGMSVILIVFDIYTINRPKFDNFCWVLGLQGIFGTAERTSDSMT